MNYQFESFLVVEKSRTTFQNGRQYDVALTGTRLYNLDSYVPVIIKGTGCIGLAGITGIQLTADSTIVIFTFSALRDEKEKQIYYNLYRNNISNNNSGDYEDAKDMVIPGLMSKKKPRPGFSRSRDDDDDKPLSSWM